MKQIITLFTLFAYLSIFSSTAFVAQNFGNPPGWKHVNLVGGSGADYATDVAHDNASNAYYVGAFNGQLKLGATTLQATALNEGFLTKVSPDGNYLWAKRFKTDNASDTTEIVCSAVEVDNAGNVVVSGYFTKGNLKIDNQVKFLQGTKDLFVAKFDPNGNVLFVYSSQYFNIPERSFKLAIDDNGQIYCLASYDIIKISPNGTESWRKYKPDNSINSDITWKNGQLYLASDFFTETMIGSNHFATDNDGIYICKINPETGAFSDGRLLAESTYLTLNGLSVLNDNEFYIAGTFETSINCEGIVDSFPSIYDLEGYVAKFNSNSCNWLLTQTDPNGLSNYVYTVAADGSGAVWIGGLNYGPITFGDKSIPVGPGFLGKIDAASGTVTDLIAHSPINSISASGLGVWQAGFSNLAAVFSKNNQAGVVFEKTPENDGADCRIQSLESDDSGLYLSANIQGKVKFLDLTLDAAQSSMLIAKVDLKTNHVIWHTIISGAIASGRLYGNSGALDKNTHKFYAIGSFADPIIYNGQTINAPDTSLANTDFIVQTNADGSAGWLRVFPGTDFINGLTVDGLGNAIVGGTFNNQTTIGNTNLVSKGNNDFFVSKLDPNGNFLWTKRGGGDDIEYSATPTIDASNNIYITAESYSFQFDWNDEWMLNTQYGEGNLFLLKISPDGTLQWGKLFGSEDLSDINGSEYNCYQDNTVTDGGGNTFICGHYGKLNKFGSITLTSKFTSNDFIGKFDATGTPVWVTPIKMKRSANRSSELDLDENGNVYFALPIRDSVFIGNQVFVRKGSPSARNILFYRFNGTTGALEWVKQTFGSSNAAITPTGISVHDAKSIFSAGIIFETVNFDNTKLSTQNGNSSFLNLLGEDVAVAVHTLSSTEKVLEIFPNPARNETNIWAKNASLSGIYEITIHNEQGDLVKSATVNDLSQAQRLSLNGLPAGLYFVTVSNDKTSETIRLVVE
ncbi:MAG: T9SS type A sorting domain-containing protein [Bacteroidota bacterium]